MALRGPSIDRLTGRLAGRAGGLVVSVIAVTGALAIGALMIVVLGASPMSGLRSLAAGAFGGRTQLANTAVTATPLLLVGTGICVAFRAKVINIGGEGQILIGALGATVVALAVDGGPRAVVLPLVLLGGMVGGAAWGAVPGALKAYLGVNEILSTIMLNLVAVQVVNYLLVGPLIDTGQSAAGRIPQTRRLTPAADMPVLLGGTRLHLGAVIAVAAAVATWVLLWRSSLGYRIRAVGAGPDAARYAGIAVPRMTLVAMTISGSLCGLAGAVLVTGSESHRFLTDGSATGFTAAAGFNGIVAALFGALHPLLTIPAAFLFGGLLVGANAMQRAIQIPASLAVAMNGLVVVFVVASVDVRRRLRARAATRATAGAAGR